MFFIAYAFNGHVCVFAGRVKIVSYSSCRTSAILKYFVLCCAVHLIHGKVGQSTPKLLQGKTERSSIPGLHRAWVRII